MDGKTVPVLESLVTSQPENDRTPDSSGSMCSSTKTTMHVTALDGIVNVNALFTTAVFIGLSMTSPSGDGAGNKASCSASEEVVRRLIIYEVLSFACFLFSSFIAMSLKLAINLASSSQGSNPQHGSVGSWLVTYGLFGSAVGSILGCLFLLLSIVEFVEVKLGLLSCSWESVATVVAACVSVGFSLLVYVYTAVYASFFM